jgi:hypothetical protein
MDLNVILEKWNDAKKNKSFYEKECDKYKESIERYMKKKEKENIIGLNFTVDKRYVTRTQISKQIVPEDVWNKYSKKYTYTVYRLKKKKS